MKLTLIGLFLICIAATFGNEEHKAHHHGASRTHQAQHRSKNHKPSASFKTRPLVHHQNRQIHTRNKIGNRINEKDPVGLEFFADGPSTLIAFVNTTSHAAVIFDFSANIVLVVNGESGNGFAIDGNRHILIKLNNLWNKAQEPFEKFYQSLLNNNLRDVVQKGKPSTDPADLAELNRISYQLGIESDSALALLAAQKMLNHQRTVLKLILRHQRFMVHGDVLRIVVVLNGVSELLQQKPESLDKVNLNLDPIINAPNGLQALLRIFQQLGNLNLSQMMGNPLSNLYTILRIIVQLRSYNAENGIDNVFRIIYNIFSLITNRGCLDDLIRSLLEAGSNGGVEIMGNDITDVIDELLKLAQSQGGNSRIFDTFITFLRELNQDNLYMNGINVSRLLTFLRRGDYRGAIDMIVNFLFRINRIVNPAVSVPRMFGIMLSFFGSPRGCGALGQLVPGLDPNQVQQLQNTNLTKLVQNREAFLKNPALRQVYNTVSHSVNNWSNGSFDMSSLFNPNTILSSFGGSSGGFPFSSIVQTFLNAFGNPSQMGGNLNPFAAFSSFMSNFPILGSLMSGAGTSSGGIPSIPVLGSLTGSGSSSGGIPGLGSLTGSESSSEGIPGIPGLGSLSGGIPGIPVIGGLGGNSESPPTTTQNTISIGTGDSSTSEPIEPIGSEETVTEKRSKTRKHHGQAIKESKGHHHNGHGHHKIGKKLHHSKEKKLNKHEHQTKQHRHNENH